MEHKIKLTPDVRMHLTQARAVTIEVPDAISKSELIEKLEIMAGAYSGSGADAVCELLEFVNEQ